MHSCPQEKLIIILLAALIVPTGMCAQSGEFLSYRITPPTRVAGRPLERHAPRGETQADPFKPREEKSQRVSLAMEGYCPVSLRDQQQWVQGSPRIQVVLGGKVYLFSGERARDIFLAAPHLYLPALDGDCLVTFAESGRRVYGQLEFGLLHANRVYFFADETQLNSFRSAPGDYLDADVAEQGACVVTKIAEKRIVLGLPATVAMVDGRRYFFASAYQRRIFEQNPSAYLVRPLRNPRAASKLEVPAFAEVIDIGSLSFGNQPSLPATPKPPFDMGERPDHRKKDGPTEKPEDQEDFMQGRAMSGYCPVTIRTQNTWRRGKAKFRHTFDGKVYFLAGTEELTAFRANARFYAPVLSGDSVVALVNEYERAAGSVFHAFFYKERLYLFANEKERNAFRVEPAQFENADLAAQGVCMVSRVDNKQEIPGTAEFETLYLGKRYRFVSAEYQRKFVANPQLYTEE